MEKEKLEKLFQSINMRSVNIDCERTGRKMQEARLTSKDLIKYVCRHSRLGKCTGNIPVRKKDFKEGKIDVCENNFDCRNCKVAASEDEQDQNVGCMTYFNASQNSLGRCYGKSEKQISQLEACGKSVTLENILTYAYIAKIPLHKLLQLREGYYFDEDGVIRSENDVEYTVL